MSVAVDSVDESRDYQIRENSIYPSENLEKGACAASQIGARNLSVGCNKDQTSIRSLELIKERKKLDLTGTGLFLIPDPEAGVFETKVVTVKDITYPETVKRGEACQAYQWIAAELLSYEQIQQQRPYCPETWCGNGRQGYTCPPGCFCSYLFCR
jgi:hypothetical protein